MQMSRPVWQFIVHNILMINCKILAEIKKKSVMSNIYAF